MPIPILATKLFMPPPRDGLVARPHLLARLNPGLSQKLTLVTAPAGSGKTTLVSRWLRQCDRPVAWLSLDAADNDAVRFLQAVTAALQTVAPDVGRTVTDLLQSPQIASGASFQPQAIIATLVNDLVVFAKPLLLALDDFHEITNPELHHAVSFWLDNLPANLHLVLLSRTTPPLPLPRLRVRRQINELTAAELTFSPQEAAEFFRQVMGLSLSADDIETLDARTEGWIAGLQLAALSLQGQPDPHQFVADFAGSNRHVMDYLLEEVFHRQPEPVRRFLLDTAILGRLTAPLCAAVSGRSDSQSVLENLEQHNLFLVPLDQQRRWYRYHAIFAEFLQAQLQRQQPERTAELHRRAAGWLAANNLLSEAIEHAFAGGDLPRAAELVEGVAPGMLWKSGHTRTLNRWLSQLPDSLTAERPALLLAHVWMLMAGGKFDELAGQLDRLEAVLAARPNAPAHWRGQILVMRAEHAIFRKAIARAQEMFEQSADLLLPDDTMGQNMRAQGLGYIHRLNGNVPQADEFLQQAIDISRTTENLPTQIFALYDLAELRRIEGRLHDAAALFRQIVDLVRPEDRRAVPVVGAGLVGLAFVQTEWNRLDDAARNFEKGLALCQRSGLVGFVRRAHVGLARLQQAQGQPDAANRAIQLAFDSAGRVNTPWTLARVALARARLWLAQGNVQAVDAWAASVSNAARAFVPAHLRHLEQVTCAQILLARHNPAEALPRLDELRAAAQAQSWGHSLVLLNTLLALTHQEMGRPDAALKALSGALESAASQNYTRLFVELGTPMAQLLRAALARGLSPETVGRLQAAFLPAAAASPHPLVEPLTNRELEVLNLLAAGLSNPEIAQEMVLATGTVAKYTNNIFGKLGVRNRTEAAARAKSLGLV